MTTLDRETAVLEALTGYLTGAGSLADLEDLTASTLFDLGVGTTGPLADLVGAIELHLAEHSNGDLSEAELRNHLFEMTRDYRLELVLGDEPQTRQDTGTASVTVGEASSWSRPGTALAVAFA